MSQIHGRDGAVTIGTGTASGSLTVVAETTAWSIEQTAATVQTNEPTMNDPTIALTFKPGETSWSGSIECKFDDTDANGQEALTIGAVVNLTLFPNVAAGDATPASGDSAYQGSAIITGISPNTSNADIVTRGFTFQGSGTLSYTAMLT